LTEDTVLSTLSIWTKLSDLVDNWSAWLAEGDEGHDLATIRRNVEKGLPCGSEQFISKLEKLSGRMLQYQPQGRPKYEN